MQAILLASTYHSDLLRRATSGIPRIRELRSSERLMEFLQWAFMDKPDLLLLEAGLALTRIHSLQNRTMDIPIICIGTEAQLTETMQHLPSARGVLLTENLPQLTARIAEALNTLPTGAEPAAAPRPSPAVSVPASVPVPASSSPVPSRATEHFSLRPIPLGLFRPRALAIGSSTGGPHALLEIFKGMRGHIPPVPIFITQHMPPKFTKTLANQIQQIADVPAMEAEDGMAAKPGHIYVAPGDFHMTLRDEHGMLTLRLNQDPPENFCRPAVDVMLRSLAPLYQQHLLVVILTGMGSDGAIGARLCVEKNARLIAQDQASSVVWGMPRAAAEAGICHAVLPLGQIAQTIRNWCGS